MLSMTAAGEDLASLSLSCRMATATTGPRAEPGMGPLMGWDNLAYRLSGLQVRWAGLPTPIETTIWRSVGYSYNMFALESFVDEIAERRGKDPVEVRRALIAPDSPLLSCLDAVVDDARWSAGDGRALGLASYDFASTSVAMVAEVAGVAGEGEGEGESDDWRVSRVWCVVDCGVVVHADAAKAQIEGGILFGLSAALHESIDVVDGRITNRNFHDYRLARLSDAPEIFVRFLSSKRDPGGLGEASTPGVAPAVANALHRLTGKRHRTLPLKG
jgi:CO/xanthine dehydrogenase Mo-binding subunit